MMGISRSASNQPRWRSVLWRAGLCLLVGLAALGPAWPALAENPVVRALLFYSPACAHCHQVMTQDLPPLLAKYGKQLQILQIDTTLPGGQALYQAAVLQFNIPQERWGVPMLIVGDVVLVGGDEIPAQFPGLVEKVLAQGGTAWPELPGLAEMLALSPEPGINAGQPASLGVRLARDPVGNTLAVIVLAGMIVVVVNTLVGLRRRPAPARRWEKKPLPQAWRPWTILALIVIGFGVACYLSYVELTQSKAVCGPVGYCNAVQESEYARLFGLIPIGVLGVAGYVAILAAWLVSRLRTGRAADGGALAMLGLTLFGTLFSIYLTFLEPFIIGATCAWCLTSAVVMTVLLGLSAAPGKKALSNLF